MSVVSVLPLPEPTMSNTSMPSFQPTVAPETPGTTIVANRLVELCNAGRYHEALLELYADDAVHVEAMEFPGSPHKMITRGKAALTAMSEHWGKTTTVHASSCAPAMVDGNQFLCEMSLDCTSSEGPMAGQRMAMKEQCLYTVRDGKITEARFFYGGC
jgi:ketosteroid isomerase-like protein